MTIHVDSLESASKALTRGEREKTDIWRRQRCRHEQNSWKNASNVHSNATLTCSPLLFLNIKSLCLYLLQFNFQSKKQILSEIFFSFD
ncbi:hypothetical protein LWI29_023236 [Acer saccharum]|uniref:Uncharacterized protein n=1 Tax=Acer saccharum TaxID=4024 RepID=A0AA39VSC6_ACESA|nr:hypothetical protein LWI29_023236 [Acer saccharum]